MLNEIDIEIAPTLRSLDPKHVDRWHVIVVVLFAGQRYDQSHRVCFVEKSMRFELVSFCFLLSSVR